MKRITLLIAALFSSGLASAAMSIDGAIPLSDLQSAGATEFAKGASRTSGDGSIVIDENSSNFRLAAVKDAGISAGAKAGYYWRTGQIQEAIKSAARQLDQIYLFQNLMIQARVVPPVMQEASDLVTQPDADTYMIAEKQYRLISAPRFSSRAPNWREYLVRESSGNVYPDPVLMPRDATERAVWSEAVAIGWEKGIQQAEETYKADRERLNRDFVGMTRFHILAMNGMVTIPEIAEQRIPLNATGNDMSLNGKLFRISVKPTMVTDMSKWKPLLLMNEVVEQPNDSARDVQPIILWDSRNSAQSAAMAEKKEMVKEGVFVTVKPESQSKAKSKASK